MPDRLLSCAVMIFRFNWMSVHGETALINSWTTFLSANNHNCWMELNIFFGQDMIAQNFSSLCHPCKFWVTIKSVTSFLYLGTVGIYNSFNCFSYCGLYDFTLLQLVFYQSVILSLLQGHREGGFRKPPVKFGLLSLQQEPNALFSLATVNR